MSLSLAGSALLFPIEKLVNGLIGQDPHIAESLERFRGKRIEVRTPHTGLNVLFDGPRVRLSTFDSESLLEPGDVTVNGPAAQLFKLLTDSERPLADSGIRVEGDAELLLDLQRTLDQLDIRWEDYLQPLLGDVLTGGVSNAAAGARDWTRQAGGNIKRNLANFVQYESRIMPTPEELARFTERVDELRLRLDRLQARAGKLLRKIETQTDVRKAKKYDS